MQAEYVIPVSVPEVVLLKSRVPAPPIVKWSAGNNFEVAEIGVVAAVDPELVVLVDVEVVVVVVLVVVAVVVSKGVFETVFGKSAFLPELAVEFDDTGGGPKVPPNGTLVLVPEPEPENPCPDVFSLVWTGD